MRRRILISAATLSLSLTSACSVYDECAVLFCDHKSNGLYLAQACTQGANQQKQGYSLGNFPSYAELRCLQLYPVDQSLYNACLDGVRLAKGGHEGQLNDPFLERDRERLRNLCSY